MNAQRKIYVLVLVLAGGALAFDQLVLGGGATDPASASAAEGGGETFVMPNTAALMKQLTANEAKLDDSGLLSTRLRAFAEERGLPATPAFDAFDPALDWVEVKVDQPVETAAKPVRDPVDEFRKAHELIAVMAQQDGGIAVVSAGGATKGPERKVYVRVGQTMDGFTLMSVTRTTAVFESDGKTAELTLPVMRAPTGGLTEAPSSPGAMDDGSGR